MSMLSFTGKTAIITGAGGSLGKTYALALAARGCNIVANDISTGSNGGNERVETLVSEIQSKGGKAVANYNNLVSESECIVNEALKRFNSCDILINNAGNLIDKSFAKMTHEDWNNVLKVHLHGTFSMAHALWPHLQAQQYGRIVNIGSGAGLYGNFGQGNYSAAKMGILGLTNTLAIEGRKHNIHVNCVVPVARSPMTETVLSEEVLGRLSPAQVSPIVEYLLHHDCGATGECFEVGGGWYSKVRFQRSAGMHLLDSASNSSSTITAEHIAANFEHICDFSVDPSYPTTPADAITKSTNNNLAPAAAAYNIAGSDVDAATLARLTFHCDALFDKIRKFLLADADRAKTLAGEVGAKLFFDVLHDTQAATRRYAVDLRTSRADTSNAIQLVHTISSHNSDSSSNSNNKSSKQRPDSDATLYCTDEVFVRLVRGQLSPEYAYFSRQLRVKGRVDAAVKIKPLLRQVASL